MTTDRAAARSGLPETADAELRAADRPIGLYVHVPFCLRKCGYCDFNSYPGLHPALAVDYLRAVGREALSYLEGSYGPVRPGPVSDRPMASVFFGGGTPTVLSGEALADGLRFILKNFQVAPGAEISVEANPGTVDEAKLRRLAEAGFNRLSLGVQAFQDRLLERIGRVHRSAEVVRSVDAARAAGFRNLNLDLIFGLPGQTIADWRQSLERAVALCPEHIAAYSLKVEKGTPFHAEQEQGTLELPSEDEELEMYDLTVEILRAAGYEHYEISNFARPGRRSVHNQIYWRDEEYLGLGAGAHSYLSGTRWRNVAAPREYIARLEAGKSPAEEIEHLTRAQEMSETAFMGLRMLQGLTKRRFEERFGVSLDEVYGHEIRRLRAEDLLEDTGETIRLTDRGLRLGNRVFEAFIRPV
ncbi:MAG: radical SAM family heme chaperone HemW [Actinobacteria bacterium]|nr:radical SAM family heme chaperone HemW [Actinomycetota bacterium]